MNEVSLKPVIAELEDLFSKFNARFFADKLEKPVITVSPDHTRGAYGWCTGWKAWKAGEDEGHYLISVKRWFALPDLQKVKFVTVACMASLMAVATSARIVLLVLMLARKTRRNADKPSSMKKQGFRLSSNPSLPP